MNDTRNVVGPGPMRRENVCLDSMRILDSCRDKDCFEDTRVFLTDFGQEIIEKTGSIRVKSTKVVCCNINADPIQFNKGFYQITVRLYTKLVLEACVCLGKSQEIEGIAVVEKKVVLYGSEGNVQIFSSSTDGDTFCTRCKDFECSSNRPTVVVEVVDPISLGLKIKDCCGCGPCCRPDDMPKPVQCCIEGNLTDFSHSGKNLFVTLGFFSVIRIERPGQYLVSASEYCVPDKECVICDNEDPCAVFAKMSFPIQEFCPPSYSELASNDFGCSCKNK